MVRSRYSISGKHMQKTAGTRRDPLSRHRQEPPVNEASGPHSLVVPAEIEHAPGTFERDSTFESRSDALKVELAQVKATLAAREREIAALKERLAALEGNPVPQAPMLGPSEPATAYPMLQRVAVTYASGSLAPPNSQRRTPRRCCEIELEFTEDTHFYAGLTQDISQGGVFIATYNLLPVGSRLELEFELPNGTHVKASGQVRWLRENPLSGARPGMGVAFSDLSEAALCAIDQFCRERPPLYMDI